MHCGAPWNAYGVTVALKGCPRRPALGNSSRRRCSARTRASPTDPVGWPTFKAMAALGRAAPSSRATTSGSSARGAAACAIFVNLFVENHALCAIVPERKPGNNCNEMDTVRRQAAACRHLEDYIDAQSGGPGKGWFRIVSDPFEARRVINAGKLAVVPGIEVSSLFDCGLRLAVARARPRTSTAASTRSTTSSASATWS